MSHYDAIILGTWIFTGLCFHLPDVRVGFSVVSLFSTLAFSSYVLLNS